MLRADVCVCVCVQVKQIREMLESVRHEFESTLFADEGEQAAAGATSTTATTSAAKKSSKKASKQPAKASASKRKAAKPVPKTRPSARKSRRTVTDDDEGTACDSSNAMVAGRGEGEGGRDMHSCRGGG